MSQPAFCVALCTYRGERYLRAQLASIAGQTRLPESLVVVDDASDDRTAEIAYDFARTAPFDVRVEVNPENLGYVRNFERAIARACGDLIVLSDQDDVWRADKLERIAEAFESVPSAGLAFSDGLVVDADLAPTGERIWETLRFSGSDRRRAARGELFPRLLPGNVVTGATLAFRADFRDLVLPMNLDGVHDHWIALMISAVAPVVPIPEPLVLYRQHGGNQLGARQTLTARLARARHGGVVERRLAQQLAALQRLRQCPGVRDSHLSALQDSIDHLRVRSGIAGTRLRRIPPITRELLRGRYRLRSNGLSSALRDLIL